MLDRLAGFRLYSALHDDGHPRVWHALPDAAPEGAREITQQEADAINAALASREPKQEATPLQTASAPALDLKPILDQIEALKTAVVSHAELHDQHLAKQADADKKFDEHAKDISNVKVTTAKAISAALDGLGEKPA